MVAAAPYTVTSDEAVEAYPADTSDKALREMARDHIELDGDDVDTTTDKLVEWAEGFVSAARIRLLVEAVDLEIAIERESW